MSTQKTKCQNQKAVKECIMEKKTFMNLSSLLWISICLLFVAVSPASGATTATFEGLAIGNHAEGTTAFSNAGIYTTISNERAHSGTKSVRFQHQTGTDDWGECHGALSYGPVYEGGEIWARAYYYLATPWDWASNPVVKVLRLATYNASGAGAGWLSVFAHHDDGLIILSNEPRSVQTTSSTAFSFNQWQSIEIYVKLSSTPGRGIFRIWKNGILVIENTTAATLKNSTDHSNIAYFWSYWNGGVPQNQTSYIDDIVITNETPTNRDAHGNPMIGPTNWSGGGTGSGTLTPPTIAIVPNP